MQRRQLAFRALHEALRIRQRQGVEIVETLDIFDFVGELGVEVRFVDFPSLEAMYVKAERSKILVSSHRPSGRSRFNCAHELGHHILNHGTKIDEYLEGSEVSSGTFDPEEYIADRFASYLLMPKTLVAHAFHRRNWKPETSTPLEYYVIAGWLGVGYQTLIYQMRDSLRLISQQKAAELLKTQPKDVRMQVLGQSVQQHLTVVDFQWTSRAIDTHVEDLVLVPSGTAFEGECLQRVPHGADGILYQAVTPGTGRFAHPNSEWASYVRVAKRGYVGRSIYRYLPDPEHAI